MQVDFTPLGAYRFFGGTVAELAGRMVDIGDVLGHDGRRLRERLGAATCWQHRFDLIEDVRCSVARTVRGIAGDRVLPIAGWRAPRAPRRITALAAEIGWSRKHLVDRFRSELGLLRNRWRA